MKNSHGYALMDAMIAFFCMAIGMLGLIAMQNILMQKNLEANFRIEASMAASELIGMAQADENNAKCYVAPISAQAGCGSVTAKGYTTSWITATTADFPNGTAVASLNASNVLTVTLTWKRANDNITHNYTATGQVGS